jgi:hypothetical protein
VFQYKASDESFQLRIQFRRSHVTRQELADALRIVLEEVAARSTADSSAA